MRVVVIVCARVRVRVFDKRAVVRDRGASRRAAAAKTTAADDKKRRDDSGERADRLTFLGAARFCVLRRI